MAVALRKESVDRNFHGVFLLGGFGVALRKESVDRNPPMCTIKQMPLTVALRKESVDRNSLLVAGSLIMIGGSLSARRAWIEIAPRRRVPGRALSLSARRAWIEILVGCPQGRWQPVALRKESVDRNS